MKKKLNVLVLGGCGFLGSHMSELLVNEGHNVRLFDKPDANIGNINNIISKVELIKGDFIDPKIYKRILKDIDCVFHFIASSVPEKKEDMKNELKNDIIPTENFLKQMIQYKVRKIIFSSSGGTVYGNTGKRELIDENTPANPISSYGLAKLMIEKNIQFFHHQYGLTYSIARTSNCYGEKQKIQRTQGAVGIFLKKVIEGKRINIWGDGLNVRYYIYYQDVIAGMYLLLINEKSDNKTYNVGTNTGTSIKKLIAIIRIITKKKINVHYDNSRKCDVQWNVLDCKKAENELGWKPGIKLEQGIRRTNLWLQNSEPG